jgi:hypothetical protein
MVRFFLPALLLFALPACREQQEHGNTAMNAQEKIPAPDTAGANNNFYDNAETVILKGNDILVTGEIQNPGILDLTSLPLRSVIVKEALLGEDGGNKFIGAYRYDGYSLFDILENRILDKKNKAEFPQCIDAFIEISNDNGESILLSWGEVFYPNNLHNIIIATAVSRIVPSKTKDLWPLPEERKLVVANDLITERNISDPSKITVFSYPRSFKVNRDVSPLYSDSFQVEINGIPGPKTASSPAGLQERTIRTIFYGKGRGIHSTTPFKGVSLKDFLANEMKIDRASLRKGLICVTGIDGYRAVFSLSEAINRNDQGEILIVPCDTTSDGGRFRVLPGCDFFSDRAVKAISGFIITTHWPAR